MPAFFEYLRNITYYLLFSTLLGMAAPSGKYKKYVSLITGLVLLLLMVQPLKSLAGQGVPVTEWFSGLAAANAAESPINPNAALSPEEASPAESAYSQWSREQIGAAFEEQLYIQVEALLSKEGYALQSAEFEYEDDFSKITGMDLTVSVPRGGSQKSRPLIRIEPVTIGQSETPEEPEDENISRVKKLIADFCVLHR